MTDAKSDAVPLFSGQAAELESRLDRFEECWNSGSTPKIVDFIDGVRATDRPRLILELAHVDLEFRLKKSEPVRVEDYLDKYPELSKTRDLAFSLIESEFELRSRSIESPAYSDYLDRFPNFADELQLRLERVQSQSEHPTANVCHASDATTIEVSREGGNSIEKPFASSLPSGARIRDYQLEVQIGEGGMGAVYRARHQRLGRHVAIKILPAQYGSDPEATARFEREMLTVGQLQHQNIVRATDAGCENGHHFLVMELLDGLDAAALLKRHGALPIGVACEIVRQAAVGLQYVLEKGLIHRDIKPGNLFLECHAGAKDTTVKILDLGLARPKRTAKETAELSTTGQVVGTVDYMSPEQTTGVAVDIRADIYSLGATLFKLLTAQSTLPSEKYQTPMQKLIGLVQDDIPSVQSIRADIPDQLSTVIARMLSKAPSARFSTPSDVAVEIEPFADSSLLNELVNHDPVMSRETIQGSSTDGEGNVAYGCGTEKNEISLTSTGVTPAQSAAKWKFRAAAGMALGLCFMFAAGVAFKVNTAEGQWEMELLQPGQEVTLRRNGKLVERLTVSSKNDVMTAQVGKYQVSIRSDGVEVQEGTITFTWLGNAVAELHLVQPVRPHPPGVINAERETAQPMHVAALVGKPARIDGLKSWTIESIVPRGEIHEMEFDSSGNFLAVASEDGCIRIFHPDGTLKNILMNSEQAVTAIAWSPDGQRIAAASLPYTVGDRVDQVAGYYPTPITIWDAYQGSVVRKFDVFSYQHVPSLDWHPDGQRLAVGGYNSGPGLLNTPGVWNADTGKRVATFECQGRTHPRHVKWSHNGKLLSVHSPNRGTVEIRDSHSLKTIGEVSSLIHTRHVSWSPVASKLLLSGQNDQRGLGVEIWDLNDAGEPLGKQPAETYQLLELGDSEPCWTPDGEGVVYSRIHDREFGKDRYICEICVRSQQGDETLISEMPPAPANFSRIAFCGESLVTLSFDGLRFFNQVEKKQLRHLDFRLEQVKEAKVSSDGEILAISQGSDVVFVDSQDRRLEHFGEPQQLAWSNTSRQLALVTGAGYWSIYDYDSGSRRSIRSEYYTNPVFSPNDQLLVTQIAFRSSYQIWDVSTDQPSIVKQLNVDDYARSHAVGRPIWSSDGKSLITAFGDEVIVWDSHDWTVKERHTIGQNQVRGFGLASDEKTILVNRSDGFLQFIKEEKTPGHPSNSQAIFSVASDKSRFYSVGSSGKLLTISALEKRVTTEYEIPMPDLHVGTSVNGMSFTKDGHQLLIALVGSVHFWNCETGQPSKVVFSNGTSISSIGIIAPQDAESIGKFVYVCELPKGPLITLSLDQMSEKFGWNNRVVGTRD